MFLGLLFQIKLYIPCTVLLRGFLRGKFYGSGGQSKRNCLQEQANFHRPIVPIFNTATIYSNYNLYYENGCSTGFLYWLTVDNIRHGWRLTSHGFLCDTITYMKIRMTNSDIIWQTMRILGVYTQTQIYEYTHTLPLFLSWTFYH